MGGNTNEDLSDIVLGEERNSKSDIDLDSAIDGLLSASVDYRKARVIIALYSILAISVITLYILSLIYLPIWGIAITTSFFIYLLLAKAVNDIRLLKALFKIASNK